jgi:hypothetical protein
MIMSVGRAVAIFPGHVRPFGRGGGMERYQMYNNTHGTVDSRSIHITLVKSHTCAPGARRIISQMVIYITDLSHAHDTAC